MAIKQIRYINQLDYADLSYPTTLENGAILREPYPSVAAAGCGLCCVCMMVEGLTGELLSVKECMKLSIESNANVFGTDMIRLGTAAALKYGLRMETGNGTDDLLDCLADGGCAILNAGRVQGVFSDGGHFLLAVQAVGETVWILDPSLTAEKYAREERKTQVRLRGNYLLATIDVIERECKNREPSFYLFRKNVPNFGLNI